MLLEGRAPLEYAAMLATAPWLRHAPKGDGHPVIVFPGLGAPDLTTSPLRRFLQERGYAAYPWQQGFNFGPRKGVLEACVERARELSHKHGSKVSLVGWSLGGIYAREIAKELPEATRCVVTLGSPFSGHPRATNAWRVFELLSGQHSHDPALLERIRQVPPVPTSSIYSKTDGVVAWQCCLNGDNEAMAEDIEVRSSHIGMGVNPLALYALADRLAQDPQQWRRFEPQGLSRWLFKTRQPASPSGAR